MSDHASDLDVTHARQALRGRHALRILVWSLALGLVALAVIFLVYSSSLAGLRGNREAPPQVAHSVSTTPGVVKQSAAPAAPAGG